MGSLRMRSAGRKPKEELEGSQVSFGGFNESVGAKKLADFLELNAGVIWRCRVKKTSTPPDSFPDYSAGYAEGLTHRSFSADRSAAKVATPHAFVHFANPGTAKRIVDADGRSNLFLDGVALRINSCAESSQRAQRRCKIEPFKFSSVGIEIGTHVTRDEFFVAWKCPSGEFIIDPFDGCCKFLFSDDITFSRKDTRENITIKCDFKLQFFVRDLDDVRIWKAGAPFTLLHFSSSPLLYYRTADDDIYESVPFSLLDDEDPWIRTTDFTPSGAIGRCSSFRVLISPRFGAKLDRALAYLKDHRISVSLPKIPLSVRDEPGFGVPTEDSFFFIHAIKGISFGTLFMVNAVLHKGIINQHQLSDKFFDLLRSHDNALNDAALRHIWAYRRPLFDPYQRLKLVQDWMTRNPKIAKGPKIAEGNAEMRRLVITPTKAHCLPPEVEVSNRILREYKHVGDRFLRVSFTDESMHQLNSNVLNYYVAPIVRMLTSNGFPQKTTVFRRVKKICEGFVLCGRRYSFLAFSSNQLRDQSAWFFADDTDKNITAASIRKWMGKFTNKNVAKYAARMGQCFSSTYATVNVLPGEVDFYLEDIKRNGYVFSDGIGKLTPELAMEVSEMLHLTDNPPSAYQIRYAGCKGVVAVWPGKGDGIRLSLRESMNKFVSNHTVLEIASWTHFQPGYLNRQIVTLLSSLDVPDTVFSTMQEEMIYKLDQMFEDSTVALEVLTTSCLEQGNTAAMMLAAGFKPQTEPHLKDMLLCVRAAQLHDLLSKARIFVPKGRWLMGCLDELGILEQGQCFIQVSTPSLENCFLRKGSRFLAKKKERSIVVDTVVVAKNPCLHPGDVRVLEAVDVPELHHLVDCLVFPQKGDRPHPNEASGSDLDGDLYFVTWEPSLIPPSKRSWIPMDYKPGESKLQPRDVTHQDIIDFFVKNIVSENLGVICNAHVVHADLSAYGAMDDKCILLAELAATAVDFPKTGIQVNMPFSLRPKVYPDFLEKHENQTYKSEKILGRLYRTIKHASYESSMDPELTSSYESIPYDHDLEVPGASEYVDAAWDSKCVYDSHINALLGQYRIKAEAEIVVGQITSLPKYSSRKQGDMKERIKSSFAALHREFRQIFEHLEPGEAELSELEKGPVFQRKASAWYQVTYHPDWVKRAEERSGPDGGEVPPRLSFAWIAADYLAGLKSKPCG
ncbi:putative RNA-dependent RNA polymerase SHL2 [Platanthera zijinensis]|uniref:RNA-dependent RNA polymerase n=1 Tax=Platanthera zijinensis TaxID=2320716 RepID=A0AAP0G560_9ASPA